MYNQLPVYRLWIFSESPLDLTSLPMAKILSLSSKITSYTRDQHGVCFGFSTWRLCVRLYVCLFHHVFPRHVYVWLLHVFLLQHWPPVCQPTTMLACNINNTHATCLYCNQCFAVFFSIVCIFTVYFQIRPVLFMWIDESTNSE